MTIVEHDVEVMGEVAAVLDERLPRPGMYASTAEVEAYLVQRVQAGIELLEERIGPDWVERIDLSIFDIRDGSHCVVGQLFPAGADSGGYHGYTWGCGQLDIAEFTDEFGFNTHGPFAAVDDGPDAWNYDNDPWWDSLQKVWQLEIAARQARG